ncbi:tyrosine-type recombinase/integrase [Spirochaeta dissipatitropha]
MSRQPFSLQKRTTKKGHVYYVQFWLEDDERYTTAKSTGQSNKTAATRWAIEFLNSGGLVTKKNITLAEFCRGFFHEDGEYARYERSRGKGIGTTHLNNQVAHLNNHIVPALGSKKLKSIKRGVIEKFRDTLMQKGLSPSTVNHILLALGIVLKWAEHREYIFKAPHIDKVYGEKKSKTILTSLQVKQLFSLPDWPEDHLVINMLAYATGMRLGEIRALMRRYVHINPDRSYIEVAHSWDRTTGLKTTKSGKSRIVPLPSKASVRLLSLMQKSANTAPDALVFPGRIPGQPLDQKAVQKILYKQLQKIGIPEDVRKERSITFHSARHFFNSQLVNANIPMLKVQALTGHQSDQMTEAYYHLDDLQDVAAIADGLL